MIFSTAVTLFPKGIRIMCARVSRYCPLSKVCHLVTNPNPAVHYSVTRVIAVPFSDRRILVPTVRIVIAIIAIIRSGISWINRCGLRVIGRIAPSRVKIYTNVNFVDFSRGCRGASSNEKCRACRSNEKFANHFFVSFLQFPSSCKLSEGDYTTCRLNLNQQDRSSAIHQGRAMFTAKVILPENTGFHELANGASLRITAIEFSNTAALREPAKRAVTLPD